MPIDRTPAACMPAVLFTSAPCAAYSCETALVLSIVMMSRMSLTGHIFIGLGDAVVGLLLGLGALSVTGGTVLPLVQLLLGKRTARRLAGGLMVTGLLVAAGCSVAGLFPYSGAQSPNGSFGMMSWAGGHMMPACLPW
jgi:hypothetical protein